MSEVPSLKRAAEAPVDDDSDDDFGPMPAAAPAAEAVDDVGAKTAKKARKVLPFEKTYVDSLPCAPQYERSFMHRDLVTHISVAKAAEFIITGSCDGHVKFWKKMPDNIEFVKHFQAHLGAIHSLVVSPDDLKVVTTSIDRMVKFFEILSFDMSHMISTDYVPTAAVWLSSERGLFTRVGVADMNSGLIRIYRADGGQQGVLQEIGVHTQPVKCMALNLPFNTIISCDAKGIIEYWDVDSFLPPKSPKVAFEYKTETDLYDLAKARTTPCTVSCSPNGELFAVTSSDKQLRVFDFRRGKMKRKYDESVEVYQGGSAAAVLGGCEGQIDSLVLGRKQAMERELEASPDTLALCNAAFDGSGNFLIYGSLTGIKVLNLVTNRVAKVLGTGESGERFLSVALYQGTPKVDTQFLLAKGGSEAVVKTAEQLQRKAEPDATVYCTSFKRRRFYCFSRRLPDESKESRDVFNEMPTEAERQAVVEVAPKGLGREAILRTSLGDIHIKLFASECPRTIENFSTLARNGYYDNVLFHRVIKGFMIQTGDPLGDGTGGESIWGGEFEDEFDRNLRHDRPFTVSMANSGPNTNGSQFFITTVPTPWLDQKHTVFGRVTSGFEVISKIEACRVNKYDRPEGEIKILGVEVVL